MKAKSAILILSGGMDSVTLLYDLLDGGYDVKALSFDYGQRHKKELIAASKICSKLGVDHKIIVLEALYGIFGANSLTNPEIDVPEGHYAAESMKKTVVPNRNMIMLSIATAWAISQRCSFVATAVHAGDHAIYPDCRPVFIDALASAVRLCDWASVELIAPFVNMTKREIGERGHELCVPFEETWSCYKGGEIHCGRCGTCVERRMSFEEAGIDDPTKYQDRDFTKSVVK